MVVGSKVPEARSTDAQTQRRLLLLTAIPLISAMTFGYLLVGVTTLSSIDKLMFCAAGTLTLGLWLVLLFRRGNVDAIAGMAAVVFGLTLFERVISVFSGGVLDNPAEGMFRPVYAFYTSLYLLTALVLPFPWSRRISVSAWLVFALVVTAGLFPYWLSNPHRPQLMTTLLYVWLGHGLFLTLLFGWTGSQHVLQKSVHRLDQASRGEQQARMRSERRLRALVDQATVGIGLIGSDNRWVEANDYISTMTGYSLDELRDLPFCTLLPEPEREAGRLKMQAIRADTTGNVFFASERQWLRKDGAAIWVSGHIRSIVSEGDTGAFAALIVTDITERKLAEQKAADSKRVEQLYFDQFPLAMVEWTPDIRVMRWSLQAEAMFGWTESEVRGRNPFEWGLFLEEDLAATRDLARSLIEGEVEHVSHSQRICRKDGSSGWCQWHTVARRDSAGQLEAIHTMCNDVSELRHALQSASEGEQLLNAVFDQAAVGVSLLKLDGSWHRINQHLCDITGYSEAELLATDYQHLTHPEDLSLDLDRVQQLIAGEIQSYEIEKRFIHKRGHVIWIKAFASRIAGTVDRPPLLLAVVEDISDRVTAAREIVEHRRVQTLHFENTPLAVIEWTPDQKVKRWSPRAEAMFGWTEPEVVGCNPFEWRFVHDDDRDAVARAIRTMFDSGQTMVDQLNRNFHRDGQVVWCHWYNSLLRNEDGSIQSVYSLVNDVSEEQLAIAALRDSQARFRGVFEQAAVGIAMIDSASNWLMVNPRFCEIVGYSSLDLLETSCQAITVAEDRIAESVQRERLLAGLIDHYQFEKRYQRRDGSEVWVSLFARRLEGDGMVAGRLALVIEDISARRESERKVQQLNASLERKVAERTRQLQETMRGWADRNHELSLLAEMMGVLPAARDTQEASRIVARYLPRLFHRYGGAIWLEDDASGALGVVEQWGLQGRAPANLASDDCWALRRGQPIRIDDPNDPLICPHLHSQEIVNEPRACTPIVALGEVIGLIHLTWSERASASVAPPDRNLIASAAEQIGLAIGNVRLREKLRQQAMRDPLTGLSNRRHFDELLERRIAEQARTGRSFALLMIDIDHFKTVNDRFGHEAGDEVLRGTGQLLQRIVRADEAVFRLGGEEFVLLVNDENGTDIAGCAERVRGEMQNLRLSWNGQNLPPITVSIGAARHPADGLQATELMRRADEAMYAAKRTGRNRVCHASAAPDTTPHVVAVRDADTDQSTGKPRLGRRLSDRGNEPGPNR